MNNAIAKLLSPHSVAVIGASADPKKTTGRPVAYLQKHGFAGRIMPVNPKVERIGDLPCYPDVASLPEVPDGDQTAIGAGIAAIDDLHRRTPARDVRCVVPRISGARIARELDRPRRAHPLGERSGFGGRAGNEEGGKAGEQRADHRIPLMIE